MDWHNLLREPRLKGVENGSPEWFRIQREIILTRPLLRYHYDRWYRTMLADERSVPAKRKGRLLELGSGGGYLKQVRQDVITSDVIPNVADIVVDARKLPFPDRSLRAIFLLHTFHHIPDVAKFLREADRTLVPGGVISIVDPSNTPFARFFYKRFHHEPHLPAAKSWSYHSAHHMESNQALSWIVFRRDEGLFRQMFPRLVVERTEYWPAFSYMATGGVTRKSMVPRVAVPLAKGVDFLLTPLHPLHSLVWHVCVRKSA